MANYQIWGFSYIDGKNGENVINGTFSDVESEFEIPCFNGIAFFKANGKCYVMRYPKIQKLSAREKDYVEDYCGYAPTAGEYGVIAGAFGKVQECSQGMYEAFCNTYPVKKKDRERLGY
jgi:hypothetical protein